MGVCVCNSMKRPSAPSLLPRSIIAFLKYLNHFSIWRNAKEFYYTAVYPIASKRKFVGRDIYGNKYYEVTEPSNTIHCRNRFIIYNDLSDYDASEIPAEWYSWLHKTIDKPPTHYDMNRIDHASQKADIIEGHTGTLKSEETGRDRLYPTSRGYQGHRANFTGTIGKYVSYSTTRPKIHSWTG